MTDDSHKSELIDTGIDLLNKALNHFSTIKQCEKANYLCLLTNGLIGSAEMISAIYKEFKK